MSIFFICIIAANPRLAVSPLALEQSSWQTGLANDACQRSDLEFLMIRDRDRSGGAVGPLLHDDVTTALTNR